MNKLIKLGVAGGLALGSLAAQASITVPSSSTPGDMLLFADIFNGTTLVATYVGDTGVSVTSLVNGTLTAPKSFEDGNLATFLAQATTGTTVDWMVGGAGGLNAGSPSYAVTSTGGTFNATIGGLTGNDLSNMSGTIASELNTINGLINSPTATSLLGKDDSSFGNSFAPFQTNTDQSNWGGSTGQVATAGLTASGSKGSLLYAFTASNTSVGTQATFTQKYDVSLTTSGLTYTAVTAVPVPAAVWLLGSGLLGLAGVARRKSVAA
jgi:hypothetical protein